MAHLSLQDWANIAQVVGGLAVIVSLAYVAYELRQNTVARETGARQQFGSLDLAYLAASLDPAVVARALAKQEQGEQLSSLEFSQLRHRQHVNFRVFENAHYQYKRGALDEGEWTRYREIIRVVICNDEPARSMWNDFWFAAEFRAVVDEIRAGCPQ